MQIERLLDEGSQLVAADIANAVLPHPRQGKKCLEAEDVPGIDKGSAVNAASEQRDDLGEAAGCRFQVTLLRLHFPHGEPAQDRAKKANGSGRNALGLLEASFGKSHLSKQQR